MISSPTCRNDTPCVTCCSAVLSYFYTEYGNVLCYLQPATVEEELQQGEDRDVHVQVVILVSFVRVQELSANHTKAKE